MEPDVVSNYLSFVNAQANNVYLFEKMDGKETFSELKGGGVLKQTKMRDYIDGLSKFKLVNVSRPISPQRKFMVNTWFQKRLLRTQAGPYYSSVTPQKAISAKNYRDSFWVRQ